MNVQLQIDFTPGLTVRFRSIKQCCAHVVYGSRKGLSGVASDMDMSPSELSKRLSDEKDNPDNRPLRAEDIEQIIDSTQDRTPVYYMVERWLQDATAKRERALGQLAEMAPVFIALAEEAGIKMKAARK
jgi:hypothetical protein